MSQIRIIGIGSPFGDDRIGWDAIDSIEQSGVLDHFPLGAITTFRCAAPATDLLPLLSGTSAAILIDATKSGAAAGTVRRIDASALQAEPENISSHGLGVPESLALGRMLGLLPETLMLYGVEIRSTGAAPGVDADVRAAIPELLGKIVVDLRRLIGKVVQPAYGQPSSGSE